APSTDCKAVPGQLLLLDPATAKTQPLGVAALDDKPLPVPLATFPANITQASTGVSGDGRTIITLAQASSGSCPHGGDPSAFLFYQVGDTKVGVVVWCSVPPFGPRTVSVNQDGSSYVGGWILANGQGFDVAQFPYP